MSEFKQHPPRVIPEHLILSRLAQSEQMREFFIQMWIQNPKLARQGGTKVQNLLSSLPGAGQDIFPISQATLIVDMEREIK